MTESDKDRQFEDGISELRSSFKMMHKKSGALENKLKDFHQLSEKMDGLVT